jgi:S-DNA-T family DNA segregation ATPase FtsK/SpoIIIE
MTAPDNPNGPGRPGRLDWDRYESKLGATPQPGPAATPAPAGTTGPDDTDPTVAGDGRVLVDSPQAQRPPRPGLSGLRAAQRRPIVPAWLRSRAELGEVARWAAGFAAHTSAYHLARTPKYAGKLVARAPRGAARVTGGWLRWLLDLEGEPVRQATVRAQDAEAYLKLARQRDRRVRWRAAVTTMLLAALMIAGGALLLAPPAARWAGLALTLAALGVAGAPADRPLLDTAVVIPKAPRLTSEMVVRALGVLGLAGINQALGRNPKAVGFVAPITRDGPGWRADVDLPPGVTVGEVADRRDKLASGLGRPLGCVWPEGNAEVHPGRLILWVGDQDMAKTRQPAWPLAKTGAADLFRPFPFGTDQRGRKVPLTLMFASMVIGSIPRMGKTFAMRLLLLTCALDARAELHAYDLKGTGDLSVLEPVAYRYRAGDDDQDIAYALQDLRELQAELRRRAKVIRGLPRDLCPENKVTPHLAGLRSYRLHPIVLGVDECQRWFEHPTCGTELQAICEDLVRRGPALGIIPVFGTQRPDARSLPTAISANAVLRFCLKVMGQVENDMVLGTSAYKNGTRATMFARADRGIGYLAGEGDDPQIVRCFYVDAPAAEQIIARARAMRERAGTLTGHALGEDPDPARAATSNLLEDILAVVPADQAKCWNETVVGRLAELRPDLYGAWAGEQLTVALKPHGVSVGQVWGTDPATGQGANRRGITRAHVAEAVAKRPRRPTDPADP